MKEFCVENLIFITEIIIFKQKFSLRNHTIDVLNSIVGVTMMSPPRSKLSPRSLNSIEEDPKYNKIINSNDVVDDGDFKETETIKTDILIQSGTVEKENENDNNNNNTKTLAKVKSLGPVAD